MQEKAKEKELKKRRQKELERKQEQAGGEVAAEESKGGVVNEEEVEVTAEAEVQPVRPSSLHGDALATANKTRYRVTQATQA